MGEAFCWAKATYDASVSSRCWDYTPYDEGWDACPAIARDKELRQIVEMERSLGVVPEWARRIVETAINFAAPCGHYRFPQPYLETLTAIGTQAPPALVHTCFTVERARKRAAMDYCLCLDGWLAGTTPDVLARELNALADRRVDWSAVCRDLWQVLGEHTEWKDLLVERLVHLVRHSVKWCAWDDDLGTEFGRDQYLGDYEHGGRYGNPAAKVANFKERSSPRVQRIRARLKQILPEGRWPDFNEWWLCAPKSFRFLEYKLWVIGRQGAFKDGEEVPGFLRCEDTYPNQDEAAAWYRTFVSTLCGWWRGQPRTGSPAEDVNARLGEPTAVKRWLVRLFLRKLKRLEENGGQFAHLVVPAHTHKRGTRRVP